MEMKGKGSLFRNAQLEEIDNPTLRHILKSIFPPSDVESGSCAEVYHERVGWEDYGAYSEWTDWSDWR